MSPVPGVSSAWSDLCLPLPVRTDPQWSVSPVSPLPGLSPLISSMFSTSHASNDFGSSQQWPHLSLLDFRALQGTLSPRTLLLRHHPREDYFHPAGLGLRWSVDRTPRHWNHQRTATIWGEGKILRQVLSDSEELRAYNIFALLGLKFL